MQSGGQSFAALHFDGSVSSWGKMGEGRFVPPPKGNDHVLLASTEGAFASLRKDGSIVTWGNPVFGGEGAPSGKGFVEIYSNPFAFTAKKRMEV